MQEDNEAQQPGSDLPTRCGSCGSQLEATEWHPTETIMQGTEVENVLVFCDDSCYDEWDTP